MDISARQQSETQSRMNTILMGFLIGLVYFVAGKLGLHMALVHPSATAVWASTGIAIGGFLILGRGIWPFVFLAAFLVNVTTAGSVATSLGIALGNTLEGITGAYLINRFANGRHAFQKSQNIFRFIVLAGFVSTLISATIGVTSLVLGGYAQWNQIGRIWSTWWLGDMVGAIVFTPLLAIWSLPSSVRWNPKRAIEGGALIISIVAVGLFAFMGENPFTDRTAPLGYLALIPLCWAAFRFGLHGASASSLLIFGFTMWGFLLGHGPFVSADTNESLMFVQTFIAIIMVSSLVLAAVVLAREGIEQGLQLQHVINRSLVEANSIKKAAPGIIKSLCEMEKWDVGALWIVNRNNLLSCVGTWHIPSVEFPEFEAVTRERTFQRGIGLPGRVWSSRRAAWVPDVTNDDNFPRVPIARKEGLHAAFCFPLTLGDEVFGVIECLSREVREPEEHFLNMLEGIGNQIGQFIERRQAEENLKVSEELKAAIFDSALDAIITIDQKGTVLEFNRAAEEILGHKREDAIGKDMADLIIPPDLRPHHRKGLEHYMATGEGPALGKRIEMRALRADGSEFPVELSIIRVGDEMPVRFSGFIRDITEQKRAAEALQKSEKEFRDFFENAELGLHWVDATGKIIRANRAELKLLGYTMSEYVGHQISEFHADFSVIEDILARLLRAEPLNEYPARMRCKDGSIRDVLISSNVYSENGKFIRTRCFTRDVTELKKAQHAQAKLAAIVASSADAIISKNLSGIVTSWNAGAERIFGYSADEMIGESIIKIIPSEFQGEEKEILRRLKNGERVSHMDTIRVAKDGKRIHVSITASPIKDANGNIIGASKVARDITDRVRAQAVLRESERRFRDLILTLPVALYTTDREGRITLYNESAVNLWGRRPQIGKDLWCGSWKILRPDGTPLPLDQCPMAVALKEDRSVRGEEILIIRPDGSRVFVLPHPDPLHDERGEMIGAINMLVDITDRKNAENELREAHEKLELRIEERTAELVHVNEELSKRELQLSTAQQIGRLGGWEWDLRSSKVEWTDELYSIYGVQPEEFDGSFQSFINHVHPADRPKTLASMQRAIDTRESFDLEERIICPDGEVRIVHSRGKVLVDQNGDAAKVSGVSIDITQHRRAEQKFRDLLEAAPDAIVITNKEGNIVIVNAQAEQLFGYSRAELLACPVTMLLPDRTPAANESNSLTGHGERSGIRKDGTEFPIEISRSPLETEDGVLISTAIRDITEQKRLRAKLVEAERLRSADLRRYALSVQRAQEEERQRISRELHDDLCQQISGMKLHLEMIAESVETKDEELFSRLQSYTRQCEDLITEVRRMSVNLRPSVLDDFGLVVALGLLTQQFEKLHKTKVNLEMDSTERLKIEPQLEIALYRIAQEGLSNIAKHAHASAVSLSLHKNERTVILRISDDGKGFRMHNNNGQTNGHAGLGLISMRERAELLDGTFSVQSAPGRGTTLSVTFPLTVVARQEVALPLS